MKQAQIIPLLKYQGGALPFSLKTLNEVTETNEMNEAAHSHNYYEMVWLTRGNGTMYTDLQEYAVEPNTIFYVKPDQAHQFQIVPGMEGFVISFTEAFISMGEYNLDMASQNSLCQLFAERKTINIGQGMENDLKEIVLKMIKECENPYSNKMELVKRYFKIFLMYLSRALEETVQVTEQSRETNLVKNFMQLLDKNFKENKMVAAYAAQLLVTPNYLNRVVKKITGYSAGYQIRQRVVLEAKRMGHYSDAGMKEIAYDLGFLDSAHFSRFFKTFGGQNFSDFKKAPIMISHAAMHNRAS